MDGLEAISDHQDTFGRINWSYGADDHKGTQVVVFESSYGRQVGYIGSSNFLMI